VNRIHTSPALRRALQPGRGGFTLAEVAVTIVIVGIGMLMVLQGLNTAKMSAAQTKNLKLSRELALLTLGQIASGQYQDDIQNGLHGTYAEEGWPAFAFDVVVGDDTFQTQSNDTTFDSWAPKPNAKKDDKKKEDPKDQIDTPYEKVKIKVTFPTIQIEKEQMKHELVLEEWIPWKQVYGEKEDDKDSSKKTATSSSAPAAPAAGGSKP
jgi:prepilin-type N-terminal cleavage/methylation domain-containing protein